MQEKRKFNLAKKSQIWGQVRRARETYHYAIILICEGSKVFHQNLRLFVIRKSFLKNRLLLLCQHVIVRGSRDQRSISFRIYPPLIFPRYNTPLLKISNVLKVKPELLGRSHHVFIWVQMNLFKPFRTVRCPKLPASYTGYNITVYIRFSRKVRYTGTKRIVNSCLRMKYSLKTS